MSNCSGCSGGCLDPWAINPCCDEEEKCDCDCDGKNCKSCCKDKKIVRKLDGVFCRKCNEFYEFAESDGDDGKCTCWACLHMI